MSIEHALIEHCSPTLASLKVGSMFSFLFPCWDELHSEIRSLNTLLTEKGLLLFALRADDSRALCYLYRVSQLAQMLADPQNAAFLREQGYEDLNSKCVLRTLCRRLCSGSGFPHEIGLFLGYPLGDVIGFMENKGKNCLCCGCWKAYTNACAAQKQFDRLNKCTAVYRRLYDAGRPLSRLTVAA